MTALGQMRRLATTLVGCLLALIARAHDPKMSGIGIAIGANSTQIGVQVHATSLGIGDASQLIAQRLSLIVDGQPYTPVQPKVVIDQGQGVIYWTATYDRRLTSLRVNQRLFPEDPSSKTIVSISRDGKTMSETILDASTLRTEFGEIHQESPLVTVKQFLLVGINHIFTGPDHILFIFGLILAGGTLTQLLKTVTAFTVAHSITLTIAATGIWVPPSRIIEPLIALSIVAVAIENLRKREGGNDWRPWIAFAFGLIHGFGFAGGLTEAGIPSGQLGWALASFNIGVELAQATIVVATFPLLASLAKKTEIGSRRLVIVGSCLISIAGAYWFVDRLRDPGIASLPNRADISQR